MEFSALLPIFSKAALCNLFLAAEIYIKFPLESIETLLSKQFSVFI